jgi:hypothetical protein
MRREKNTENGIKGARNEGRMDAAGEGDDILAYINTGGLFA